MRNLIAAIAWLTLAPLGLAQITADSVYAPHEPIVLGIETSIEDGQEINAVWRVDSPAKLLKAGPSTVHIWAPPKAEPYQVLALVYVTQTVEINGIRGDLLIGPPRDYATSFTVKANTPPKPPPDPGPGPEPPGPGPDPSPEPEPEPEPEPDDRFGPSPFAGDGLRAVIVYEYDDIPSYESGLVDQLYSENLRSWARANMAQGAKGVDFRIFDKDAIGESRWAELLQRERDAMPWLIAGNGRRGYEGPLPSTEEETIRLLQELVE